MGIGLGSEGVIAGLGLQRLGVHGFGVQQNPTTKLIMEAELVTQILAGRATIGFDRKLVRAHHPTPGSVKLGAGAGVVVGCFVPLLLTHFKGSYVVGILLVTR